MKYLFYVVFIVIANNCFSQNQTVAYSREYEFKEGVFLTITDFYNNTPIDKNNIVSNIPKNDLDFLHQITNFKYIVFKDISGVEQKIEASTLWGYCQNRAVYLNYNNNFNRLNVIGTICHFTAVVTNYINYRDPMYMNYGINSNAYDELKQFILDTQTNKIMEFNAGNMELILKSDDVLYSEFMKLKKRKKSDSIFVYMRKYNEKHPLYLNAN